MSRLLLLALLWALSTTAPSGTAIAEQRELLRDPGFEQGFRLLKPQAGVRVVENVLSSSETKAEPVWEVAQWFSRWPQLPAKAHSISDHESRWANAGKLLALLKPGSGSPEMVLSIKGSGEFGEKVRTDNEPWPHLLVEQSIAVPPALSELEALRLKLGFRIKSSRLNVPERYDPSRHAAQFLLYLHVSNMDRTSKEFGHYLHFGVPLYDNRYASPATYFARDTGGTGMVIYVPAASEFMKESPHDGAWIEIDRDLLPLIREGLKRAWDSGNLTDRREPSAYRVTFLTLGWELPGNLDVSAHVRGLSIKASMRE